jgi:TFIIF-interacting CTD phosphatase-like protein
VYVPDADFVVDIKVTHVNYRIYVRVRPGAEEFI